MADACREIENLIYEYAARVDAGDFVGVGELFAHATFRSAAGGQVATFRGSDAVRRCMESMVLTYDGVPATRHVTTNVAIQLDDEGGRATARSYYSVLQARPGLPLQVITAGSYEDRFERVEGVWRFADRLVHFELRGDLSHHLRYVPEE